MALVRRASSPQLHHHLIAGALPARIRRICQQEVEIYAAFGRIQEMCPERRKLTEWENVHHDNGDRVAPSGVGRKCQQTGRRHPFCLCAWNRWATQIETLAVFGVIMVDGKRRWGFKCQRLDREDGCEYIAIILENAEFIEMLLTKKPARIPLENRVVGAPRRVPRGLGAERRHRYQPYHRQANSTNPDPEISIDNAFELRRNLDIDPHHFVLPYQPRLHPENFRAGGGLPSSTLGNLFRAWDSPLGVREAPFLYALGRNIQCPFCNHHFAGADNYEGHLRGGLCPEDYEGAREARLPASSSSGSSDAGSSPGPSRIRRHSSASVSSSDPSPSPSSSRGVSFATIYEVSD